jgi:hypothetical protein
MIPSTSQPGKDKEPNITVTHMAGFLMPPIPKKLRLTTGIQGNSHAPASTIELVFFFWQTLKFVLFHIRAK